MCKTLYTAKSIFFAFQLETFYLAKFFTQPAVMLDVTNIKNDSVLLYLGCILSAEKVDKI